jgi:phospholipid/cholesterol/gamma-HCH transport system substrate-binding protein
MTIRTKRARLTLAGLAAAAATVSGCGFHGLYGVSLPGGASLGSHPYSVTIYFDDVLDLVPQSAVKVNDVAVGRVETVRLSDAKDTGSGDAKTNGWTARVTVEVNGNVKLPENARAAVKMTSLLGEKYVDLEEPLEQPATTDLHNGSVIPITRTKSAPDVEEVLGALSLVLNGGGLQQIHTITTELNNALDGRAGAVKDLLNQLNTFVGTLDQQKSDIINALESIDKLAVTLNGQRATIVSALQQFPPALHILSSERTQLVTMLSSLSNLGSVATRVINETQTQFVDSLKLLQAPLEQLTASGSNLPEALKIAGTFPFPVGLTREIVHGDYTNLHVFLDLNLTNELCGVNKALCNIPAPTSVGATPINTQSSGATALGPGLLGAGG